MPTTKKIAEEVSVMMPVIARRLLMTFFQKVKISQTQIFTIMALTEESPCPLNVLSHKLGVAAPTVTGIVDRLEKSGHVKRVHGKKDRRVVNVNLTAKGRRLARKTKKHLQEQWGNLLSKLPKKDQMNYVHILRKLQRSLP